MTTLQVSDQKKLRQFIDQIERLTDERDGVSGDIKDKYAEAKSTGFDPKIIKRVVAIRKKGKTEHQEEEALLATYLHAVSWITTPLGAQSESDGPRLVASNS